MHLLKLTRRRLALGLGGVATLLLVAVLATGWYYSDEIEDGGLRVKPDSNEYDVEVVKLEGDLITLRLPAGRDPQEEPGTMGLEWANGYSRVGEIVEINGDMVVRRYEPIDGSLSEGIQVRFDNFAFPGDPERAHGISYEEVTFPSSIGEFSAWQVDGNDDTWAIFVHGKGSSRGEALRILPVVEDADLPSLIITYRNDAEAPQDPRGRYQYGLTEWEDLQAASEYALANGADDLLLVGYSMGGGIIVSFLYNSQLADRVVGVVLDSPMLDFGATIDLAAQNRNLPQFLTEVAKIITGLRFGIDWGELDYLSRSDEISVPILLFHSNADDTVPVSLSNTLAESRPDLVTYVPFSEAPHVGLWNEDSERYEAALREFIDRVAIR